MPSVLSSSQAKEFRSAVDSRPLASEQLHTIASAIFRSVGCRVFSEQHGAGSTPTSVADLVVWHDSLDADRGAPIVVEILARTHATGAMLPRLRRTKHATGVRTLIALSSGGGETHVDRDEDGVVVQVTFGKLLDLLTQMDLNEALKLLTTGGA